VLVKLVGASVKKLSLLTDCSFLVFEQNCGYQLYLCESLNAAKTFDGQGAVPTSPAGDSTLNPAAFEFTSLKSISLIVII
jgi:hypothetical protein